MNPKDRVLMVAAHIAGGIAHAYAGESAAVIAARAIEIAKELMAQVDADIQFSQPPDEELKAA